MFSNEERSGLVLTLIGGGLLVVTLLVAIGFFSDSKRAAGSKNRGATVALDLGGARGRVVDGRSGVGLVARTVEIEGVDGIAEPWFSDAGAAAPGSFEVRGLPASRPCRLVVGCDGFATTTRALTVEAGRVVELGDVALTPLATIVGEVVDTTGAGVADADVELAALDANGAPRTTERGTADALWTKSDARGGFRFERALPQSYVVGARSADGGDTPLPMRKVDVTGGGELERLTVVLAPTFVLRGKFEVADGGAPLVGALLIDEPCVEPGDPPEPLQAGVASDGAFTFHDEFAGRVRLIALTDEKHGVAFDVGAPFDGAKFVVDRAAAVDLDVALKAPEQTPEPERAFSMSREGEVPHVTIAVHVVDGAGAPTRGARLDLVHPNVALRRVSFANRAGNCVLRDVLVEQYTLFARLGELTASTELALDASKPTNDVELRLELPKPEPTDHR